MLRLDWRRGPESNRRLNSLLESALPLGYRASDSDRMYSFMAGNTGA